jgi:hypothetical protein
MPHADGGREDRAAPQGVSRLPMRNKPIDIGCNLGTRIEPGDYAGYVRRANIYRDPYFQRWTCRIEVELLDGSFEHFATVPMWLNLGNGKKPHAGRRGSYFKEWFRAGGDANKRRDRLSPNIFEKRIVKVRVASTAKTYKPQDASVPLVSYSVVKEILAWETGSLNQDINQINNINEGIGQGLGEERVTEKQCHSRESAREKEKCAIESNDAFRTNIVPISAPARVESGQDNPTQRRGTEQRPPQRHYSAQNQGAIGKLPEVNIAERGELLKAQAAKLAMQVHSKCNADGGLA